MRQSVIFNWLNHAHYSDCEKYILTIKEIEKNCNLRQLPRPPHKQIFVAYGCNFTVIPDDKKELFLFFLSYCTVCDEKNVDDSFRRYGGRQRVPVQLWRFIFKQTVTEHFFTSNIIVSHEKFEC